MNFKIRETKIGYYIDVYYVDKLIIEGCNIYQFREDAEEWIQRLVFSMNNNKIYYK